MAAMMMKMLLLGVASAAYQGGGDQTYDTEDEHLGHGGPGGNGPVVGDDETKDTDDQVGQGGKHSVASASYQGGGHQTYDTDDDHLGHGGPGGNGSMGVSKTGVFLIFGLLLAVILSLAAWSACSVEKSEQKPQLVLEMTVGADLEEAVERVERKDSKNSQISIAASDAPLTAAM